MNKEKRLETLLYNAISLLLDCTLEEYDSLEDWFEMAECELGCTKEELMEYGGFIDV